MSQVYVTTYEIIGAGLPIAHDFYNRQEAAREEHFRFAEDVGGQGYRPHGMGGLSSVFFAGPQLPAGWRKIGTHGSKIEARPNNGTKLGKAFGARIAALPRLPQADDLASALGYSPKEMVFDSNRGTVFFPTELRVAHPIDRMFVRLPRIAGDDFKPDETMLRAIPESELMKAVEDHNAETKRLRDAEAT